MKSSYPGEFRRIPKQSEFALFIHLMKSSYLDEFRRISKQLEFSRFSRRCLLKPKNEIFLENFESWVII